MSGTPLLSVQLEAGYGRTRILQDVCFEVAPGELFGLAGGSGQGKSTLVMALLGLLPWRGGWARGQVLLQGENLLSLKEKAARKLRGKHVALVPQSPMSALNSAVSLRRHFQQAWLAHQPRLDANFDARLQELMNLVHLPAGPALLDRKPGEVSVGQAQRAVLALGLLHRPALLILDEPTSALDPCTQVEILKTLRELNRAEGTALLYISHDLLSILQFCDTLAVLDAGRIAECVAMDALTAGARHPATQALLRTLPLPLAELLRHRQKLVAAQPEPQQAPLVALV